MSDLEQRLADELHDLATGLRTPHPDTRGLAAAGRRESVRRRARGAGVIAAVAAVVGGALAVTLPSGEGPPDPARPGPHVVDERRLDRPLELPWWGSDDGVLRVDGAGIAVAAEQVVHAHGVTLVRHREGRLETWSVVENGALTTLTSAALAGDPVLGPDGSIAWLERPDDPRLGDPEAGPIPVEYLLHRQPVDGARSTTPLAAEVACCDAAGALELTGVLPDGRPLLTRSGLLETWDADRGAVPVTGVPDDVVLGFVDPWPGGAVGRRGDSVVAARIPADAWRPAWEAAGSASGAWSADGEQYAEAGDGEVRFASRRGTLGVPLEHDDLRVVGWESDTEVVVAQYLEADEAVTGLWRCSSAEARCALIEPSRPGTDAFEPGGRILLPGL